MKISMMKMCLNPSGVRRSFQDVYDEWFYVQHRLNPSGVRRSLQVMRESDHVEKCDCLNPSGVRRSFQGNPHEPFKSGNCVSTPPESGGHFKLIPVIGMPKISFCLNPSGVRRSFQVQQNWIGFKESNVSTPPESGGHFK